MTDFKNYIAGQWVAPSSGAWFENRNPADTTDLIGRFPLSSADDVNRAVASATKGFSCLESRPGAGPR